MTQAGLRPAPPLRIAREGELVGLEFGLVWHQLFTPQDAYVIFCAASDEGRLFAFNLYFPKLWRHAPAEGFPPDVFAWRSPMAIARSVLPEAQFAAPLAALWALPAPAGEIAAFTDVEAVSLSGRPDRVLEEKLRLKLFVATAAGADAELYLNIDFPNRLVMLREKSAAWRPAILAALLAGSES